VNTAVFAGAAIDRSLIRRSLHWKLVKRGCSVVPVAVTPCAAEVHARDWAELLAEAPTLVGKTVHVRGPLGVGPTFSTLKGCLGGTGRACCNSTDGAVVIGGASKTLALEGFYCSGDDSEVCCNAPAYGHSVIASGKLTRLAFSQTPRRQERHTAIPSR
jgi:hypothetical protein